MVQGIISSLIVLIEILLPIIQVTVYYMSVQEMDTVIKTSENYGKGFFFNPPHKDSVAKLPPIGR